MSDKISTLYHQLLAQYGPQGWWPLVDGVSRECIYHKGNYSFPTNSMEKFEICIGAILTQNTSWKNVIKAILNLKQNNLLNPESILKSKEDKISNIIKSAGYYNQKTVYLKNFSNFFLKLKHKIPIRNELLNVQGIGNETADSMLLYAYYQPEFVIDNYTKKFLLKNKMIEPTCKYMQMKQIFEKNLDRDIIIFQEFHALIVEWGKNEIRN